MTTDFQQTNVDANSSALVALCSGNSNSSDKDSNQAEEGGTPGSTERTHSPDISAADLNGVWMEIINIDDYDGASGTWITRLSVTTGNHQLTLDEIHICRVNSSYVNQETLGSLVAIGDNLSSASVRTHNVTQSSSTTVVAGDKIIVIYAFDNAQSMPQSFGYTPDQITQGPGTIVGAAALLKVIDEIVNLSETRYSPRDLIRTITTEVLNIVEAALRFRVLIRTIDDTVSISEVILYSISTLSLFPYYMLVHIRKLRHMASILRR